LEERCTQGNPKKRSQLEDISVDEEIILKRIFKKGNRGMGWINLAQDRNR
jgi:hypothetical protein